MSTTSTEPSSFELPSQEELREIRLCLGLSIVEVAERGGWTPSTVQRWERGQHSPTLDHVRELMEIYADESEVPDE